MYNFIKHFIIMIKKDLNAIYIIVYVLDEHFNITVTKIVDNIAHITSYVGCTIDDVKVITIHM